MLITVDKYPLAKSVGKGHTILRQGKPGERYTTSPHLDLEYELLKNANGEYVIPGNAVGEFDQNEIIEDPTNEKTKEDSKENETKNVKTGDSIDVSLLIFLISSVGLVIVMLLEYKRRKEWILWKTSYRRNKEKIIRKCEKLWKI